MTSQFISTFWFALDDLVLNETLGLVKEFIFYCYPKYDILPWVFSYHHLVAKMKEAVHCWKIDMDNIDDDNPYGIHLWESEGEHTL